MKKSYIRYICLLMIGLLLLGSAGCSLRPIRHKSDPFRLGFTQTADNFNPYAADSQPEALALSLLYDTLFVVDETTGEIQPGLCIGQSITTNADGSYSWDLEIRSDIYWHDGQPLTAEDVMFTLKTTQLFSTLYGSPYCDFIYGGNMTVIDDTHLSMVIWDDYAYKEAYLAQIPILPEHIWNELPYMQYTEASQARDHAAAGEQLPMVEANADTMIGSGPWRWGGYQDGVCRLLRNESHWQTSISLERVELHCGIESPGEAMLNGSIDACWDIPVEELPLLEEGGYMFGAGADLSVMTVNFNLHKGANAPLSENTLRQAMDAAVDRNAFGALIGGAEGESLTQPGSFWQTADASANREQPDSASLLEQSGYSDRNGDGIREDSRGNPLSFELIYSANSPVWEAVAEWLAEQWQTVGVDIFLSPLAAEDLYRRVSTRDYDLWLTGYTTGGDPAELFGSFYWGKGENAFSTGEMDGVSPGWNDSGYRSEAYDALYESMIHTKDIAQRKSLTAQLEELLYADAPVLVLGWPVRHSVSSGLWREFRQEDGGLLFTLTSLRPVFAAMEF